MSEMKNNQEKNKKHGGVRPGAGRKHGSVNKIQGGEFLEEYKRVHGSTLKEDLVKDMLDARLRGDREMLFKYQTAFAKYYFSDIKEIDVTSGGETFRAIFNFPQRESDDWVDD